MYEHMVEIYKFLLLWGQSYFKAIGFLPLRILNTELCEKRNAWSKSSRVYRSKIEYISPFRESFQTSCEPNKGCGSSVLFGHHRRFGRSQSYSIEINDEDENYQRLLILSLSILMLHLSAICTHCNITDPCHSPSSLIVAVDKLWWCLLVTILAYASRLFSQTPCIIWKQGFTAFILQDCNESFLLITEHSLCNESFTFRFQIANYISLYRIKLVSHLSQLAAVENSGWSEMWFSAWWPWG